MQNINFLLDSARGVYIPRDFVTEAQFNVDVKHCQKWHINEDDALLLALGPELEGYWETWERVLNEAYIVVDGKRYTLHHDGDLFAVAFDSMTEDEISEFIGE